MADRLREHCNHRNDGAWLGMLVETMNRVSLPDVARRPSDRDLVDALKAKLERPAATSHPSDIARQP